ncbi:MAG: hypothetical protein GWN99_12440 [Gemmatimonadetes bacterium]|uniref:Uncharacterized protein n=1 Tax=Candidatus Kutchimonas denitrificans TaxID=3056748 RepID=A0AAE5CDD0_9BACT|nr:hypothetical protein [Gemmatimonadota bacterium]NIR75539.1 hypothetical protein [Candidatus Kutchimonas denitrificans]NIS01853.1 hypothetical protein [Gemmatimonadota bacterium]NIT67634.1 hypothetical protein [Gemmatimonadota bacterium]NIU53508.1 hypothetical protein [Gemmatimonadota bacterium]
MKEESLALTGGERYVLQRSFDVPLTRRKLRLVVVSAAVLIVALVVFSPILRSWEFLLFFSVAYVGITAWQRVGYARTILVYKGLVRKLVDRIDELEGGDAAGEGPQTVPSESGPVS